MTASTIGAAQRQAARIVGFTYLFAMLTAVLGFYIRGHLTVEGNAVETAQHFAQALARLSLRLPWVTDIK